MSHKNKLDVPIDEFTTVPKKKKKSKYEPLDFLCQKSFVRRYSNRPRNIACYHACMGSQLSASF